MISRTPSLDVLYTHFLTIPQQPHRPHNLFVTPIIDISTPFGLPAPGLETPVLEPKIPVLGNFAARKFAVGKLAAQNFCRTRPEQTPFMGIWLTISTWYKLQLAPLTEQTQLASIDYLVPV